jgi:uncharacterized membrane protein YdjX (TVP38/TMEM64 family)
MQPLMLWSPLRRAQAALVHWRRGAWKRRYSESDGDGDALLCSSDDPIERLSFDDEVQQRRWRLLTRSVAVGAAVLLALVVLSRLPVTSYMVSTSAWIRAHPLLGPFVAIVLFWLALPLCIPSTILEAIAGSLFGVSHGVVVILIGKTGGSWLTFLVGRHVGRAVVGDYLSSSFPTFRALSDVLTSASWKPLVLFQLASIPNLFKCYGLAITHISSWRFIVSSAIGSTPHAFVWANIGSQASDIASIVSGQSEMSTGKLVLLVGGAFLTAIAMAVLIVYTKRELAELQKRECASGSEDEEMASPIIIAIESSDTHTTLGKLRANTYG